MWRVNSICVYCDCGFMKPENLSLIANVTTVDGVLPALRGNAPPRTGNGWTRGRPEPRVQPYRAA
jgi:hypothetical protein